MLEPGQPAPPFSLESDAGETVTLESLKSTPTVIYFYPKDDTTASEKRRSAVTRQASGECTSRAHGSAMDS